MNNDATCAYIEKIKNEKEYLAESFVDEGLGQTTGGYLGNAQKCSRITQKEHFLNYYSGIPEKMPSYNRLRCPQLVLFIAEAFGVPEDILKKAYKDFYNAEKAKGNIGNNNKNGNYFWGTEVFRQFKATLKIGEVNRIIKENDDISNVIDTVSKLFE